MEPNILDPKILFSCDCNLGVLYTHSPCLGVRGSAPKKGVWGQCPRDMGVHPRNYFFWDVCWPIVLRTHVIGLTLDFFPWYFPYKRKHCNTTVYGIVLYWKRYCESMKRKCSGFAAGCIPSSFWTVIKGLAISLWT